ncbi:hypothetical protein DBV23_13710 [Edwardsiella ictaluri]|nr:hypothetical protein B6E78_05620 [Edwardsiella ictaluri]AVZ83170.1 hypothetical protein DBV23_13710 [Edwardsiella ictaluri]BEH99677.1 hypothetical protein KH20906_24050 [Edwardsiella ictaluri]BEI03163.1 hypothetical protein KB20921_24240 [Edwardsiella ictaluri]BEI06624.1 hypothetical protein KH201010_24100 [Edwardsiella ictaluri]
MDGASPGHLRHDRYGKLSGSGGAGVMDVKTCGAGWAKQDVFQCRRTESVSCRADMPDGGALFLGGAYAVWSAYRPASGCAVDLYPGLAPRVDAVF